MPFEHGSAVPRIGAVHRIDDTEIVDVAGDLGEYLADRRTRFAVTTKTKGRSDQVAMAEWEREHPWLGKGKWTAVLGHQAGLGVKTVYVAGPAEHEQHDHPLGARSHR